MVFISLKPPALQAIKDTGLTPDHYGTISLQDLLNCPSIDDSQLRELLQGAQVQYLLQR